MKKQTEASEQLDPEMFKQMLTGFSQPIQTSNSKGKNVLVVISAGAFVLFMILLCYAAVTESWMRFASSLVFFICSLIFGYFGVQE